MSRCRNLIFGLLAAMLYAHVNASQFTANMFLNGEYQNGLKSQPAQDTSQAINPAGNIFLEHAIISRQAKPFQGPTYLPPVEYLKCASGQQCVRQSQCQNGYYTQQLPKIQKCVPETDICCTYRAPPTTTTTTTTTPKPYLTCGRDSDCVSPRDCRNGEIIATDYVKKQSNIRCYAPELCCRMPSTTLTDDGYIFNLPETKFPLPTNPTVSAQRTTESYYRPETTQPAYRPQPTSPAYRPQGTQPTSPAYNTPRPTQPTYRPQPTQPAYRVDTTRPTNEYLPPQTTQSRQTPAPRPQPTQPSYRPQPTQPTQPAYRPQPTLPTQTAYRPQPTLPTQTVYHPQPTQPAYRPDTTRLNNEYLPPQPTQSRQTPATRPQPTQPAYRPQPTQHTETPYRPETTQPAYRPTQPAYRPTQPPRTQPTQPAYRPTRPQTTKPTNEYLPPVSDNEIPRKERPEHPLRPETPQHPDRPQQPDYTQRPEQPQHPDYTQRPGQPQHPDYTQRPGQPQRPDYTQRPEQPQRPDYTQRPEQPQRPDYTQRPEQPLRPNYTQRPEQPQRPDYTQRPGQPQHPDYTQRPGQPQRPEHPQRPERPQTNKIPYDQDRVPQPSNEKPIYRGEDLLSPQIFPSPKPIENPVYYAKCASALVCTDESYCNAIGVITDIPVELSPMERAFRVPMTDCLTSDTGAPGKCCRDSNYVDPWPVNLAGVCASRNKNTKPTGIKDIDTNFAEIPWQVMILKESTKTLLGGGAIIGDEIVLTSASSVSGVSANDLRIKAGEWELGSTAEPLPFQLVSVKSVEIHPDYNPTSGSNDMALIRLQKRFEFATHIQPICISDEDPSPSEQCVTTGWGKQALQIHEEGAIMHVTSTTPQARSDCGADSSGVCSASKFDACEFDSGSALACGSGSNVRLKGIYNVENACGEGQTVRFTKPDVKWINTAFAQKNKPLLQKRRV